jgi:hypothetical protein
LIGANNKESVLLSKFVIIEASKEDAPFYIDRGVLVESILVVRRWSTEQGMRYHVIKSRVVGLPSTTVISDIEFFQVLYSTMASLSHNDDKLEIVTLQEREPRPYTSSEIAQTLFGLSQQVIGMRTFSGSDVLGILAREFGCEHELNELHERAANIQRLQTVVTAVV